MTETVYKIKKDVWTVLGKAPMSVECSHQQTVGLEMAKNPSGLKPFHTSLAGLSFYGTTIGRSKRNFEPTTSEDWFVFAFAPYGDSEVIVKSDLFNDDKFGLAA